MVIRPGVVSGRSTTASELPLTSRERSVLLLVANGFTAAAAARRLAISPRTVEKHIEHIYAKIGVADKVSAARWATKAGVVADLDAGRCADCPSRAL